jgi:predicted transcriptional regulator
VAGGEARARGALEREVLTCLAATAEAKTAAQVQAEIGGGLAYTTVMTTLSRLHAKGAIERRPAGRAYEYSLVGGTEGARSNMTAHQMLKLLDEQADRAGVLTRFIAELKPEDEQLLAELIDRTTGPEASATAPAKPPRIRKRVSRA